MKNTLLFIITLLLPIGVFAKGRKDEMKIRTLLQAQVIEWNKGNIEGYMHGYWEDDSLLFIGSKGPQYSFKTTLSRYKVAYPDTAHMGKLTSVITKIDRLSAKYYFVVGKWQLERTVGNVGGSYTLLLRKMKRKWVIVADHSS